MRIGVIGLGYVGRPLFEALSEHFSVMGYDIDPGKVTGQGMTNDASLLAGCDVYIIAVPTPTNQFDRPDLRCLISASETVGGVMSKGCVVVYESTVYPGATEEECVPALEKVSGLCFGEDFSVGYSPERINPGDHENTLTNVVKVVSGSDARTTALLDGVYNKITQTHCVSSIRVAEASKVIENTQRDVNIALMNEFALMLDRFDMDPEEVFEAARTKWNFLPFTPGLVGGHCIGVDPYYLVDRSHRSGFYPEIISASRRVNESMVDHIAGVVKRHVVPGGRLLILGLTFKANCDDMRNTKVLPLIGRLRKYEVEVLDPHVHEVEGVNLIAEADKDYDGVIFAVPHDEFGSIEGWKAPFVFNVQTMSVYNSVGFLPEHHIARQDKLRAPGLL